MLTHICSIFFDAIYGSDILIIYYSYMTHIWHPMKSHIWIIK